MPFTRNGDIRERFISSTISVLFLILLLPANSSSAPTAHNQYDRAYQLLQSEDRAQRFPEIVMLLRKAAEQGHPKAQYSLAIRYLFGQGVGKDYSTAADWLKKAAEQGLPEAQLSLGLRYYWGQGVAKDYTRAAHWFEKAAQQNQPQAREYLKKVSAAAPTEKPQTLPIESTEDLISEYARLLIAEEWDESQLSVEKDRLERLLTDKETLEATVLARRQSEDRRALSREQMEQELAKSSRGLVTAEDYFYAANNKVREDHLRLAIELYQKSLQLKPDNANSYRNLASAYLYTGDYEQAIVNLKKSLELNPTLADKHATLAMIYHIRGELESALSAYRKAIRLNPGLSGVYLELVDIFIQQNNYPAAWKSLHQAELLGVESERFRQRLRAVTPGGREPESKDAEVHLRQLVFSSPENAEQARQEILAGESFNQIANQKQLKQYSSNGGYWGPYQAELLAPAFNAAIKDLAPLELSKTLETEEGYLILQKFLFYPELAGTDRSSEEKISN